MNSLSQLNNAELHKWLKRARTTANARNFQCSLILFFLQTNQWDWRFLFWNFNYIAKWHSLSLCLVFSKYYFIIAFQWLMRITKMFAHRKCRSTWHEHHFLYRSVHTKCYWLNFAHFGDYSLTNLFCYSVTNLAHSLRIIFCVVRTCVQNRWLVSLTVAIILSNTCYDHHHYHCKFAYT